MLTYLQIGLPFEFKDEVIVDYNYKADVNGQCPIPNSRA